jgi:hypothetical protein
MPAQVAGPILERLIRSHEQTPPRSRLARLFGISPLSSDEKGWYLGALEETAVGRMLNALDDRWTVVHDVPVGSGAPDVDHVVIGPGGVFTVNANHHPGQSVWVASRAFLVGGQRVPELRRSEYGAERATARLSRVLPPEVDVTPVIALVGATSITVEEQPAFVQVMDARGLVRWLRTRPQVLDAGQVASLVVAARNPDTWHSSPAVTTDTRMLQRRFAALDREVRSARLVRVAWAAAAILASGLTALMMIPGLGR